MTKIIICTLSGAREGSPAWIAAMNQSGKASFEQLLQHPGLLKHYVKEITDSMVDGQLPLEENETVPCKP